MKKFPLITPLKMLTLLVIISAITSVKNCNAQSNFHFKPIPAQYQPSADLLAPYRAKAASEKSSAYDLTKSLPQGYVTDGSINYTTYLQKGLNSNSKVVFPNFPVLVDGLALRSNSTVIFDVNSKLILAPTESPNYNILSLLNVQNVTVYFPVLVGDRKNHKGTKGEWGMGIYISGATNINIINPVISDCWGDGIYLGRTPNTSKDVQIYYPVLNNNRRNGISIISADGLTITRPLICNTNGTSPEAGIDFEPNGNADQLNNIIVDDPITYNNAEIGIAVSIWGMRGKVDKDATITIKNHIDDGSDNAFLYQGFRDTQAANNMNGHIKVINPMWKNNKKTFVRMGHSEKGPNIEFKNVSISKNSLAQPDSLKKLKRNFRGAKIDFH
jgi:parallel beta-helix repeat protein